MYDLDLTSLRLTLVKGVRMIVAMRRLAKDVGLDNQEFVRLEREVREAAAEVQRVEVLDREDKNRPLVQG